MLFIILHERMFVLIRQIVVALLATVLLAACSDSHDSRPSDSGPEPRYSALIERTGYGTAHITADDWGSLGFGQGYAIAQDRICVIADQMLKVRSERARYLGPGKDDEHITYDFAYLALGVMKKAESILATWPEDGQEMAHGYVAGINRYLEDTGVDALPDDCAGQDWVQNIDVESLVAYTLDISMLAGSRNFLDAIANAIPPGGEAINLRASSSDPLLRGGGSNAVALGSDRTTNGKGLLLANPHWPWEGERRMHEVQLTIPGEIDVAGITLPGLLGVMVGFNESIAWAHTTSTSNQFNIYTLDLVSGSPTRYRSGEEEMDMEATTFTIEVQQADGSFAEQSRTLYSSHYGPMLDLSAYGLAWTDTAASSIFDVNAKNVASTFGPIARAKSVDELREVFLTVGGRPGNNTLATDRHGAVFYADTTLVPNLSEEAEAAFRDLVEAEEFNFTQLAFSLGFVLLDGSDPLFSIDVDDSATVPGAIPFSEAPQLTGRRDFVANSNDSFWLSNPAEPLTGYSLRWGDTETPRRLRTRMGLTQISESAEWDSDSLKDMLFANRSYTDSLWRDQFVGYCSQFQEATSTDDRVVDISTACAVLSSWDGRYNLDSIGAIVYRELLSGVDNYGEFAGTSYFTQPFDALDPVATPSGLSPAGQAYLLSRLADAVLRLQEAEVPLDAPLGDYQYSSIGDQRFAIHGGRSHADGIFNVVAWTHDKRHNTTVLPRLPVPDFINRNTGLSQGGYVLNFGATFILVVEFTDNGPVADAILVYSQSDDPDSPHFSDQMPLYSSKTWRPLPFTREQIESDPKLTSMTVTD